jgi:ABC-type branched-subunit amino acid transport system substrate-binding protein
LSFAKLLCVLTGVAAVLAVVSVAAGASSTPLGRGNEAEFRIGLLDLGDGGLFAGAAAAIDEINASRGMAEPRLQIVAIEPSSPWRDTGSLLARAVFERGLSALIGPTDGTAAHVAAQVGTKSRIPVMTLAAEDSLTEAGDPWVFRGIPGDGQQAQALLQWVFGEASGGTAAIVVPPGREGRTRGTALSEACRRRGVSVVAVVQDFPGELEDMEDLSSLRTADVLFLWLDPEATLRFLRRHPGIGAHTRLLGNLWLGQPEFVDRAPPAADGLALPVLLTDATPLREALAYDMVKVLAASVRAVGPDPLEIRQELLRQRPRSGRTGEISFGPDGERAGPVRIGLLRDGELVDADPFRRQIGDNGVPGTS